MGVSKTTDEQIIEKARQSGISAEGMATEDLTFVAVGNLSNDNVLLVDQGGQLWQAHKVDPPDDSEG